MVPFSIPSPPPEWRELAVPDRRMAPRDPPVRPRGLRPAGHDLRALHHRGHRRRCDHRERPADASAAASRGSCSTSRSGRSSFGIIGARFYHVLTHPDDYFGPGKNVWNPFEPGSIWAIWEGGVAIFGSLIGGALGVYIGCRFAGLRFWSVADAIAPGLLVAQALGRLGNWFNQELFGLPTDLPWGLEIDRPNAAIPTGIGDDVLFHPTFLYELIWNLVGFGAHHPDHERDQLPPVREVAVEHLADLAELRASRLLAVGQGARALPDLVRRRPRLVRVDPPRSERDLPRHPLERLGRAASRSCSGSSSSSCRPGATPVSSRVSTCRVASGSPPLR